MDFKLPLAVFSQDAEDHKKRYKENYDPSKNYPKYSGVMQITEDQIIKLCEYVQKAQPEHSDFHGEGVVTIRATGYLNESKQGKKYILFEKVAEAAYLRGLYIIKNNKIN